MTIAMFRQLMPSVRMPPSPKKKAWMTRAALTARQATSGPAITAISTAPTACAVVPPATGTLSIMTRNEKAAPKASTGIILGCERSCLVRRLARYQTGTVTAQPAAIVSGPR